MATSVEVYVKPCDDQEEITLELAEVLDCDFSFTVLDDGSRIIHGVAQSGDIHDVREKLERSAACRAESIRIETPQMRIEWNPTCKQ